MSQIIQCKKELDNYYTELAAQRKILTSRADLKHSFQEKYAEWMSDISQRQAKAEKISEFSTKSTFAKSYEKDVYECLWGADYSSNNRQLQLAQEAIANAVNQTENEIQKLETMANQLSLQIDSLQSQYHEAVRREQEASAAKAVTAKQWGGK